MLLIRNTGQQNQFISFVKYLKTKIKINLSVQCSYSVINLMKFLSENGHLCGMYCFKEKIMRNYILVIFNLFLMHLTYNNISCIKHVLMRIILLLFVLYGFLIPILLLNNIHSKIEITYYFIAVSVLQISSQEIKSFKFIKSNMWLSNNV